MKQRHYCIQCTDNRSGRVGTFFYELSEKGEKVATSPIFTSLVDFYRWAHEQGYKSTSHFVADMTMTMGDA